MIKFRDLLLILLFFTILPVLTYAQNIQPNRLVIAPTAGSLPSKTYMLETHLFDGGGVEQRISVGLTELVDVGISYSGSNIIGSNSIVWQPHVGAQIRIRIIEESMRNPGFSIGFDSQGDGQYIPGKDMNRFRIKSKGAYLVISRNYRMLGDLGVHGGVNYSFEDDDGDRDPSFWIGIDKNIGSSIEICCEYDFATNDNENKSITSDRGYLNSAVKLNINDTFTLEFDLQNILRNSKKDFTGRTNDRPEASRELRFYYSAKF